MHHILQGGLFGVDLHGASAGSLSLSEKLHKQPTPDEPPKKHLVDGSGKMNSVPVSTTKITWTHFRKRNTDMDVV